MEIIPKPYHISIEYTNMQTGSESIEETKENIEETYEELTEINELLLGELEGDVKNVFSNAKDITEKKIHLTTNILGNLSFAFTDYVKQNKKIDTQANHLAGGSKNE